MAANFSLSFYIILSIATFININIVIININIEGIFSIQVFSPASLPPGLSNPEAEPSNPNNPQGTVSIEMEDYVPMHMPSENAGPEVHKQPTSGEEHNPAEYELPQATAKENIYEHIQ